MIELSTIKNAFKKDYKVISILGKGGMATVFKAIHNRLNRIVALKVIPREYSENLEFKLRFEKEAVDSAKLAHPNIITIYDSGEQAGYQYISMEYLPNGSLLNIIKSRGRLTETEAINILIPILQGISFAHNHGVIHRDIKSSNIMFDADNRPVLMDFGISKSKDDLKLTVSGSFIGTLEYASPEQIESSDKVDSRSDLYSVGIIAYEMVTGSVPFRGSMSSVINQVIHNQPPSISTLGLRISRDFENIITKAVQKKPQDRFQTAEEFIDSLQKINTDEHFLIKSETVKKKPQNEKPEPSEIVNKIKNTNGKDKKIKETVMILSLLSILLLALIFVAYYFYISPNTHANKNTEDKLVTSLKYPPNYDNQHIYTLKEIQSDFGINMIKIEGGEYLMGSDNGDFDEKPSHPVNVKTFYMSSTEITQKTWRKVMGSLPEGNLSCSECPVVNVSWYDALEFIKNINQITKRSFSLPYECEWEYAAKEGVFGLNLTYLPVYSGSIDPGEVGWYKKNSSNHIHPVAQLMSNKLGIYDLSGNVWEWCNDYYDPYYYKLSEHDCTGPKMGNNKVIRGGSYLDQKLELRNTNREKALPTLRKINVGFRVVLH